MKHSLLLLFLLPTLAIGQTTYVPDDNFENYLENNGMGDGIVNNDYVLTANISSVTFLAAEWENISDLTGIEDFTALTTLDCYDNQLTSLDVSNNTALVDLRCYDNQLTCLNVKNGNNTNMTFYANANPNLTCIEVDDVAWSTDNWTYIDTQTSFSTNCNNPCSSTTGIPEPPTKPKELLFITDLLGRTTYPTPNTLLFYLYDDGSVEKGIQLKR